jgi:hypothetical protein
LVSFTCSVKPELKASTVELKNEKSKKVLSQLLLTFPLDIAVSSRKKVKKIINLSVEQNYLVENLDLQDQVKVPQNFIVK